MCIARTECFLKRVALCRRPPFRRRRELSIAPNVLRDLARAARGLLSAQSVA